jgi:DNA-binding PadR family transcriptional regulator
MAGTSCNGSSSSRRGPQCYPGALYPALHRLEERELIAATWGPSDNNRKAKFYELTAAGRKQLEAQRKQWELFSGAVAIVLRDA